MAEQFHQWVQNMPWYERLYYELFDPQAITCSTHYTIPGIYFVMPFVVTLVIGISIGAVTLWLWSKRKQFHLTQESRGKEQ